MQLTLDNNNKYMEQNPKEKDQVNRYKQFKNTDAIWVTRTLRGEEFIVYNSYRINEIMQYETSGVRALGWGPLNNPENQQNLMIQKLFNLQERKRAKLVLRDLKLSRIFQHENIQGIETILLPRSREELKQIYVVGQPMDVTLKEVLSQLGSDHVRFFLYQILRALKYIHSAGVIHNNLHLQNMLVNGNCDLKVINFQNSKHISQSFCDSEQIFRNKPPELRLGYRQYNKGSDIWSVGCIFAQMLKQDSMFLNLNNYFFDAISEFIEIPEKQSLHYLSQQTIKLFQNVKLRSKADIDLNFTNLFPYTSPLALDLLKKMLVFDPDKRITVQQALTHPYMDDLHLQEDEPSSEPLDLDQFQYQSFDITDQQLQDILYEEILLYHFGSFREQYQLKKKKKLHLYNHIVSSGKLKDAE